MEIIDWTCDTCCDKTHGSGAIHIEYAEIRRAEAERKSWYDRSSSENFMRWDPMDALIQPQLGRWKVECHTCAAECEGSYWIDLHQARTTADLDRWTEHLSGKGWFTATNWPAVVGSVGRTQPIRNAA